MAVSFDRGLQIPDVLNSEIEVTMECVPGSTLPYELRKLGLDLRDIEPGERILHSAITEKFTLTSSGALEPLTADSTKPIAQTRLHAGFVKTRRFVFDMR